MAGKATPAITAAERAGVTFSLHEYDHDPRAPSYGEEAAEALGLDPDRVFKTLVVDVDGELTVALVPVTTQLDLRALGKRVAMADMKLAERTTGYVAGGISPLGQRKALPTVIDETAELWETIYVSAGRRGLELELAAADLAALTGATFAAIARSAPTTSLSHAATASRTVPDRLHADRAGAISSSSARVITSAGEIWSPPPVSTRVSTPFLRAAAATRSGSAASAATAQGRAALRRRRQGPRGSR